MNGLQDYDGFFRALSNLSNLKELQDDCCLGKTDPEFIFSRELNKSAIRAAHRPRITFESPPIDLAPVQGVIFKFDPVEVGENRLFCYVRFARPLWDFRTGRTRIYWGKRYEIGLDGSIDKAAPKGWRWMRGEYSALEMDLSTHGGWADSP